ncbi:cytochrome P450 monooxygenase-like protein [Arabidopsis thaliana]|uniref:Cytochrome P450 monooxygenase-like protein n=1 Tax=Arabidopsis thaliana TaxID=3702 RepID=Q9LEX2_ARATH|nr:cytochrome P450, family 76, subfamily C, polypeptide 7 [Arabidopsis thaliana]AEE80142.1 cytochrome P450, family 76, subfamily C, polypeptide 7 [Arabidopsis thaliana]CAB94140.1 cytochrome P450 monooxygenase-like protein [Arabidopsis thaliana]|eukprot:NP_191663.1 cytochrome P450, family 76, subfamily C, polypeptide 7 [Arabidopsis thaliana]
MDIVAIVLSLLFIFFLFFFFYTTGKSCPGGAKNPPGPSKLSLLRNILQTVEKPHRSLADLSRIYGSVMSFKLGCLTTVVISSPETAKEVLKTHDHVLSYRVSSDPVRAAGHHELSLLWIPPLARWRFLRKITRNQLFSTQRLEATSAIRTRKVQELMNFVNKCCERREAVNISRASFITSLNIISNALFSTNLANFDDSKTFHDFQNVVIRMMEISGKPNLADFFPFLGFLDLQGARKEARLLMHKLFRVFQGFIDTKRSSTSRNNNDMLDSLLDIAHKKESELDDNNIKHLLLDLFLAGVDTSSSAVEWAMAELLRNPKMIVKVQEEIRQVIGLKGTVQDLDIVKLPYLQAVVKESLRLHPPAPFLVPRKSESDDVQIFEFLIPKNTQVLVNVWAIGRDPNVWKNPTQFEPERFLGRGIDVKGNHFELIPFGAGRRICPGMPLAFRIMHLVLASLLYGFDWEYQNGVVPENVDMNEAFGATLHKAEPLCIVPIKKRV